MQIPNADDLTHFIDTLLATEGLPVEVRNECHRLLLAVRENERELVTEILARLKQRADQTGLTLPHLVDYW